MAHYTYAIIGTGALGGYYGALLQRSGATVHFLLNSDYPEVLERGLIIESPDGDFVLPQVNAYQNAAKMPSCDVVIVALKTTQNHLLPQILPPVVKENGVVLVLQNGLGVEDEVAKIVGDDRVMGGLCFLCSNKVGPGHIRHLDYKEIKLGDYRPNYPILGITPRLEKIAQDMEAAGIPIKRSEDLLLARWQKLVWNIPYNGLSVVLNARTDEMMQNPQIRQLVTALMEEVALGAKSSDRIITPDFIQLMLSHTDQMTPYRPSMKIDYDEKRPLEIETMFGNPLKFARSRGVELPKIGMLYQQLKFLSSRHCQV